MGATRNGSNTPYPASSQLPRLLVLELLEELDDRELEPVDRLLDPVEPLERVEEPVERLLEPVDRVEEPVERLLEPVERVEEPVERPVELERVELLVPEDRVGLVRVDLVELDPVDLDPIADRVVVDRVEVPEPVVRVAVRPELIVVRVRVSPEFPFLMDERVVLVGSPFFPARVELPVLTTVRPPLSSNPLDEDPLAKPPRAPLKPDLPPLFTLSVRLVSALRAIVASRAP